MSTLYLIGDATAATTGFKDPNGLYTLGDVRARDQSATVAVDNSSSIGVNFLGALSPTAGSSVSTIFNLTPTYAGPIAAPGLVHGVFYSAPLASSVTIQGSIAVDLWMYESSMSANVTAAFALWVIRVDGTTDLIATGSYGTELTTTMAQVTITATPTSTVCNPGDVIMFAPYSDDATATTMGGSYTSYLSVNAPEGSTGDSQIRFTENLTFVSNLPSGTTLYFTPLNSDLSGSEKLKLWTDNVSNYSVARTSSPSAPNRNAWTSTVGGSIVEWYSPQLNAVTIQGLVRVTGLGASSGSSTYAAVLVRLYKTDSDGSNPVLIGHGRGETLKNPSAQFSVNVGANGTLADGQRILVRLYVASGWYIAGQSTYLSLSQTGIVAEFYMDSVSIRSRIQFPATLTQYNPTPPTPVTDYWGSAA